MTQTTVETATELLPGTEMLPDIKYEMVPYNEVEPDEQRRIDDLMKEIDLTDSNSIIILWQQGAAGADNHLRQYARRCT